ncbi:MAG: sulfotransferase family protein, partial [Isosphaeraceae bacterium]
YEMLVSQEKMLARLNKPAAPRAAIERSFIEHLRKLRDWLRAQPNIEVLYVCYNKLLEGPEEQAKRVSAFLEGQPDTVKMAETVDSLLYRNRKTPVDRSSK